MNQTTITFDDNELHVLKSAIEMADNLCQSAPIVEGLVNRSEATKARRAMARLKSKIDQYGDTRTNNSEYGEQ